MMPEDVKERGLCYEMGQRPQGASRALVEVQISG